MSISFSITRNGYKVPKSLIEDVEKLRKELTVKPYIPSVFVKPQYVKKYTVFGETESFVYVPKQFGISRWGSASLDIVATSSDRWAFAGTVRPAQIEVVNSYLKPEPHDGMICLQTGGGKTVCALYIASQLRVKTLIVVHNTFLLDQWVDRIKAFLPNVRIGALNDDESNDVNIKNFTIRRYPDGSVKYKNGDDTPHFKLIKNIKKNEVSELADVIGCSHTVEDIIAKIPEFAQQCDITIGMLQRISMSEIPKETFRGFGLTVIDECHHIASEVFVQAFQKITSKHMLGLSATPDRKDGLMYVIEWFLGPILYRSESGDKVDEAVHVEMYRHDPTDVNFNRILLNNQGVMNVAGMVNKLAEFVPRTDMLVKIIGDILEDPGRQILVLSDRVQHCKDIWAKLDPEKAAILAQNVASAKRAEFCASKRVLIATYSMCKEGFDVATLNTLVMATPRPDIDQIVGRILRTERSVRKIHPLIVDIVDSTFRRQFQARLKLYKDRNYVVDEMEI